MNFIDHMNDAIDYLEEHLLEEPDLNQLGKMSGCSPHHFQRIFTYLTGVTLSEYVRRRKMTLAAADLRNRNNKVIDIAYKYGYDSPTAFTRAFQSVHGVTPAKAKKDNVSLCAFAPIKLEMMVKGHKELKYRIVKAGPIRIVGKKYSLKPSLEENYNLTPLFWKECAMDGTVEKLATMMDTDIYGLMGVSILNKHGEWEYYIAVSSNCKTAEYAELIIPENVWAVFTDEGPLIDIQKLETRIIMDWLPTGGYEYVCAPEIELYLNSDPEHSKFEIWLPVKRKEETV